MPPTRRQGPATVFSTLSTGTIGKVGRTCQPWAEGTRDQGAVGLQGSAGLYPSRFRRGTEECPRMMEATARLDGGPAVPAPDTARAPLRRLAWPLGVFGLLIVAATATLVFLNRSAIHSIDQADPTEVILPIGFVIIGALLAARLPQIGRAHG